MTEQTWIPEPSDATRPFFEGAQAGKLRLLQCSQCATWSYPPATLCSNCGGTDLVWQDASGRGTVYAHGRLARPYHPRHKDRLPLVLAQVDIDEGLRLMTNLVDVSPEAVRVGDKVEVGFETFPDGGVIPVFKPVAS